jgi:hypothetical protein
MNGSQHGIVSAAGATQTHSASRQLPPRALEMGAVAAAPIVVPSEMPIA